MTYLKITEVKIVNFLRRNKLSYVVAVKLVSDYLKYLKYVFKIIFLSPLNTLHATFNIFFVC